jgi:putative membrane protein
MGTFSHTRRMAGAETGQILLVAGQPTLYNRNTITKSGGGEMMMGFGFLGMLLFWGVLLALLAGGVVWVFRQTTSARPTDMQGRLTARQVLDERFARGEISSDEYETIRAQIER